MACLICLRLESAPGFAADKPCSTNSGAFTITSPVFSIFSFAEDPGPNQFSLLPPPATYLLPAPKMGQFKFHGQHRPCFVET